MKDRVLVEAGYNPNMPFKWNATRIQVLPNQRSGPTGPPAAAAGVPLQQQQPPQQQQKPPTSMQVNPTATPNTMAFSNSVAGSQAVNQVGAAAKHHLQQRKDTNFGGGGGRDHHQHSRYDTSYNHLT